MAAPGRAQALRYALDPLAVADGVWMLRGADAAMSRDNGGAIANLTIIATDAGAVLVDAGPSLRYGQQLQALARKLTGKPVARVYLTHLHPDHSFGAAAFDPAIVAGTAGLKSDLAREGPGLSDAMYRLVGDWMRGTELRMPGREAEAGSETIGGRTLRLVTLAGHSGSDLALIDEATGVLAAGDLVFHDRAPATPHADLARWRAALDTLSGLGHRAVVPGHGPFDPTPEAAIAQTRDWLIWLDTALAEAAASGLSMVEAGALPIPPRFATMAAARYELQRSVAHLYPALEAAAWERVDGG